MLNMRIALLLCAILGVFLAEGNDQQQGNDDDRNDEDRDDGDRDDEDRDDEEDIFLCYRAINCELGDDIYQEVTKCYDELLPEDEEQLHKWHKECGHDLAPKSIDECVKYFCSDIEEKDQKDWFNDESKKVMQETSEACQDEESPKCKRWNTALDCIGKLINDMKEQEKCACEEEEEK